MENCTLPLELVELILESIIPARTVLVPLYSTEARTLYACLFLCKSTYQTVQDLFYSKCLHIKSATTLKKLVESYGASARKRRCSQSLYLDVDLLDAEVIGDLQKLFEILASHLRRLILHQTEWPETPKTTQLWEENPDIETIQLPLRNTFSQLTAVEEFVGIAFPKYLDLVVSHGVPVSRPVDLPVWASWTSLKRLAYCDHHPVYREIANKAALPALATLVHCTRDGLDGWELRPITRSSRACAMKIVFADIWHNNVSCFTFEDETDLPSEIRHNAIHSRLAPDVTALCLEDVCGVSRFEPRPDGIRVPEHDLFSNQWYEDRALDGTLWDFRGVTIDEILNAPQS